MTNRITRVAQAMYRHIYETQEQRARQVINTSLVRDVRRSMQIHSAHERKER